MTDEMTALLNNLSFHVKVHFSWGCRSQTPQNMYVRIYPPRVCASLDFKVPLYLLEVKDNFF